MRTLKGLRQFAIERHAGQLYGQHDYVHHLDAVYAAARRHGLGEPYERAAYGHDLLEDTATTLQEVKTEFGELEGDLVYSVSGLGATRAARRAGTLRRLAAFPMGIDLKGVDRIANLSASLDGMNLRLVKMYLDEKDDFAPVFAQASASVQSELAGLYARAIMVLNN